MTWFNPGAFRLVAQEVTHSCIHPLVFQKPAFSFRQEFCAVKCPDPCRTRGACIPRNSYCKDRATSIAFGRSGRLRERGVSLTHVSCYQRRREKVRNAWQKRRKQTCRDWRERNETVVAEDKENRTKHLQGEIWFLQRRSKKEERGVRRRGGKEREWEKRTAQTEVPIPAPETRFWL